MKYRIVKTAFKSSSDAKLYERFAVEEFRRPWSLLPFVQFAEEWIPVKTYSYDSAGGCFADAIFFSEDEAREFVERLKVPLPTKTIIEV